MNLYWYDKMQKIKVSGTSNLGKLLTGIAYILIVIVAVSAFGLALFDLGYALYYVITEGVWLSWHVFLFGGLFPISGPLHVGIVTGIWWGAWVYVALGVQLSLGLVVMVFLYVIEDEK